MKNIKHGDNSLEVSDLQEQLKKLLFPLLVDGDFGNKTFSAVTNFQKWNNLPPTGIVDDITYSAITTDIQFAIDKVSFDRISALHPIVRAEILHLIKKCYKNNVKVRVVQGYRTFAEQDELYAQGRTKPGPIVTKAKGGLSNHNYALAIDFCLLHSDGSISWSQIEDADHDGKKDWMEVVDIFKSFGYDWGGEWRFKDTPHLEKTFGKGIRTLLNMHNTGQVDSAGYVIL